MWKPFVCLILLGIIGVASLQIYGIGKKYFIAEKEFNKLEAAVGVLEEENKSLEREAEYFKNPDNLLKELRARFNYKLPGEKFIIVVPEKQQGL